MADPVTRMHYFDHQFLRAEDFTLEQRYQNRMRRLHNSTLHTSGIVNGLEVDFVNGATSVTVAKGVAIDSKGQEMVLDEASLDVANYKGKTVYVTIAYAEQKTNSTIDTGVSGDRNVTETPTIAASDQMPTTDGSHPLPLLLATVTVGADDGKVTGKDLSGRKYAGVAGGDLQVRSLTLTSLAVDAKKWPSLTCSAENTVSLKGDLSVGGNLILNYKDIYLGGPNDKFHGIGIYGSGAKLFAGQAVDGPIVYGNTGGGLGTTGGGQQLALSWTTDGKLHSPMWKVTSLVQGQAWPKAPAAWTLPFSSGGGTVVLIASGSVFSANSAKTVGVKIQIDDGSANKIWSMVCTPKFPDDSRTIMTHIVVPGLAMNTQHSLMLSFATPDTKIADTDLFSITLLELPF